MQSVGVSVIASGFCKEIETRGFQTEKKVQKSGVIWKEPSDAASFAFFTSAWTSSKISSMVTRVPQAPTTRPDPFTKYL
ncbi:hypothetical protein E2C01_028374 [Portunus trituberculatus]|uniref:Uncharacterized protein n=1 Tax=Portunus trituberculatus TaxID=210409 RepID=A0A5B7EKA4_PORTR|nr:hypothetical protein [Portunus trituberculatus]